ncbi:hypothetical protein HTZ97_15875 [Desulfuromonas acetoxidans]|nr:hypothetical protein [Desulfuromonas acetoxidans]MBF0646595.1 hypothetical protein [Desulfuromonas acetoxidans]NVD26117.1 hypothetical protein [Desulfuromonas acetoxidans]NVE17935.1 hypothetical protein [Desulfuromonas acetoxidans]
MAKNNLPHYIVYAFCSALLLIGIFYTSGKSIDQIESKQGDNNLTNKILNSQKAKNGEKLLHEILVSHRTIDQFYYVPHLWGELTESPKMSISLPAGAWDNLTEYQQGTLEAYVASKTVNAWLNPFRFSSIKENAPIAWKVKESAKKMKVTDWEIIEGKLTNNGRDILHEKTISTGEKWQGKDLSKYF